MRTMAGACWPPRNCRLVAAGLVSVGLMVLLSRAPVTVMPASLDAAGGGGLFGGRPISELWAIDRPEQAWFTSAECRPLVTRFTRDHCLPLVYLASFPRSGNTWTRYLLEASTGLFTTSGGPDYRKYKNIRYKFHKSDDMIWQASKNPGELVRLGYLGESMFWTQGITIAAKTHIRPQSWNQTETEPQPSVGLAAFPENANRRAVLIIRDPFKSFISLRKYGKTKSVINTQDMIELYRGEEWKRFVVAYTQLWYILNTLWIQSTNETHVLAYERLTRDPIGELTSLLHFLDIEPDQRRIECVRSHLEGKAHNRRHGVVPDNETYPLRLRAELWSHIHQLNWLLKNRGYPALPLQHYSFAKQFGDIGVGA